MLKGRENSIKKVKKKKSSKDSIVTFFVVALMIIGWYIMMYPTGADLLNKIFNQNSILSYNQSMTTYSNDELEEMLAACQEYNETIYEEQQVSEFHYRGPNSTGEDYLKVPTSSSSIGTVRIPAIDVNLQIVHGTSDQNLQSSVGHLYGTSLPVEGKNVHAVIAAHSALSTAKLFTDLTKVNIGDVFYITILNKEYEYTVDDINVVLPEDDYKYEQIIEGENHVTLYTCTPYGVNTHRLLVRGKLTDITEKDISEGGFSIDEIWPIVVNSAKFAFIALLPFFLIVGYAWYDRHERIKKKKGKQTKQKDIPITKEKEEIRYESFEEFQKKERRKQSKKRKT